MAWLNVFQIESFSINFDQLCSIFVRKLSKGFIISATPNKLGLHLRRLLDQASAYCTEMGVGRSPFHSSVLWEDHNCWRSCGCTTHHPHIWACSWTGLSLAWPFSTTSILHGRRTAAELLSLQAVHRVSADLLWPEHKSSGSPCSEARSPARPPRSGPGRWKGSSRGLVWRRTGAKSGSRPGWTGDCFRWTRRTSDETRGWRWPWSPLPASCHLPPPTWCYLAPLGTHRTVGFISSTFLLSF